VAARGLCLATPTNEALAFAGKFCISLVAFIPLLLSVSHPNCPFRFLDAPARGIGKIWRIFQESFLIIVDPAR
jgi:hypothetical protein